MREEPGGNSVGREDDKVLSLTGQIRQKAAAGAHGAAGQSGVYTHAQLDFLPVLSIYTTYV